MNYDITNFPLDIILNIIGIVIFFLLVKMLLYKPAKKIMDARKKKLAEEKENAEKSLSEAEELKKEYAEMLHNSEENARAAADKIIADAHTRADEIVNEAETRAAKVLSLAESKIISERQAAMSSLEHDTVTLALDIAEKILERRVSDSDTINMAQKFFENADISRK